jgi:hypothetical protein
LLPSNPLTAIGSERSLRALVDLLQRNVISLESLAACACAPHKESTPNDCDTSVQPWRWLQGRLTFLLHLTDSGLLHGPDARPFLRKIRAWCNGFGDFPHLRCESAVVWLAGLSGSHTPICFLLANRKKMTLLCMFCRLLMGCPGFDLQVTDRCSVRQLITQLQHRLRSKAHKGTTPVESRSDVTENPAADPSDDEVDCSKCVAAAEPHESLLPLPVIDDTYVEGLAWVRGELLGSGAYSRVYQAMDFASGRAMAVKQLSFASTTDEETILSIERELNLMRLRPQHPHTVPYYGFVRDTSCVNIFMELVTGCSLSEYLSRHGPLPPPLLRVYAHQLMQALVYLHDLGVIHRDVKCANVLLNTQTDSIKLCDYGVSGLLKSGVTVSSGMLSSHGTPAFMAPEVIRGERYGRRADVWSFGCTLIEMATAKAPWCELGHIHPFALMYRIAESQTHPAIPDSLGPDGIALVQDCLQRTYAHRPASASLLDHPFFTIPGCVL